MTKKLLMGNEAFAHTALGRALPWSQAIRARPRASLSKPLRSACRRVPPKTCMLNGRPMKGGARVCSPARRMPVHVRCSLASSWPQCRERSAHELELCGRRGRLRHLCCRRSGPYFVADRARYASFCVVRQDSLCSIHRALSRVLKCSRAPSRFLNAIERRLSCVQRRARVSLVNVRRCG